MTVIESKENKLIKKMHLLHTKKGRDAYNQFIIEGEKFVGEIPTLFPVDCFVFSESYAATHDITPYENRSDAFVVKDALFRGFSDTVTPQGILAVCEKQQPSIEGLFQEKDFFIIAEGLQDPGNLGTLIRTADAAGVGAIFMTKGTVDLYSPKVMRATAGAIFHLPIFVEMEQEFLSNQFQQNGILTIGGHLKGEQYPYEMDLTQKVALWIGNEGNGLSDRVANQCDYLIKIPMVGKAESLNASVASGVLLYEVVRQRICRGV